MAMKRGSSEMFDLDRALSSCYDCSRSQFRCHERREMVNVNTCTACLRHHKRKFQEEKSNLEWEIDDLKANLDFLRYGRAWTSSIKGDVTIVVQGNTDQPLDAHKVILASKSPVFCKMLESDMLEKETGILRISDVTLPVMGTVVHFFYEGEIEFTDEVTATAVLEVAHKYDIKYLMCLCEEDLIDSIDEGNLGKMLKLARKFSAKRLEAAAYQFFKENFDSVVGNVLTEFS